MDPAAGARLDAARRRIVGASQRIVELLPSLREEPDLSNCRKISQEIYEVLGGIGDIAIFADKRYERPISNLRLELSSMTVLLMIPHDVQARMKINALPFQLGMACSIGVDPTGTDTKEALAGGIGIPAISENVDLT